MKYLITISTFIFFSFAVFIYIFKLGLKKKIQLVLTTTAEEVLPVLYKKRKTN